VHILHAALQCSAMRCRLPARMLLCALTYGAAVAFDISGEQ
jgi:hypothetical protein